MRRASSGKFSQKKRAMSFVTVASCLPSGRHVLAGARPAISGQKAAVTC